METVTPQVVVSLDDSGSAGFPFSLVPLTTSPKPACEARLDRGRLVEQIGPAAVNMMAKAENANWIFGQHLFMAKHQ